MLLALQGSLWAHQQYAALPFPPYEIYQALFAYVDDANLEGVSKALTFLKPLCAVLREKRGKDVEAGIRRALDAGDPAAVKTALLEMIFEDMLLNLTEADAAPGIQAYRENLQRAFMDYNFLSPALKASDAALDAAALREFKAAYRMGNSRLILELAPKIESALPKQSRSKGRQ